MLKKNIIEESIGQSVVNDAITNHSIVKIFYDGDENTHKGERIIEPYVLGRTSKMKKAIRAFQPYGDTQTSVPNWKIFLLQNITSWTPTNETFDSPPEYRNFNVEPYNPNGDGQLLNILSQAKFDTFNLPSQQNDDNEKINNTQSANPKIRFTSPLDKVKEKFKNQQNKMYKIPNDLQKKRFDTQYNDDSKQTSNDLPSVGPLTNPNSITNDSDMQDLLNNYQKGTDNNDYSQLDVTKQQLLNNLKDYQKKKNKFKKQ